MVEGGVRYADEGTGGCWDGVIRRFCQLGLRMTGNTNIVEKFSLLRAHACENLFINSTSAQRL